MYSRKIRDCGYEFWVTDQNDERVADKLRREFTSTKKIDRKTVAKFRREDDWEARLRKSRAEHHERQDEAVADSIGDIEKRLQDAVETVFLKLTDLEPKSFAEAVHSLPTLFTQLRKVRGEDGETNREQVISRTLKALKTLSWFANMIAEEKNLQDVLDAIEFEFGKN